ncbi:cytoplasmic tRNA 2-thiolation protein 2-A-like [Tubulanus polymorphus]|uniref:cytoplasmic tRNA 2-thiolation protein 2-A-like n=1 Tax=Tubulanus polymorphus TaxID=672921 RepID=UPI003DA40C59
MCSILEGDNLTPVVKSKKIVRICMKCDNKPIVIIRIDDAFCRDCFWNYCIHKFRSTFGRTHIVKHKEKVLLAYSGGHGSTALLHMVIDGLSERCHKKIGFIPGIVYINEGATLNLTAEENKAKCDEIVSVMEKSGLPYFVSSLENALNLMPDGEVDDDGLSRDYSRMDLNAEQSLRQRLAAFKTLTAKMEFIKILRHKLILDIARRNGYNKVMTGETAMNLSIQILSNIAQGKGAHISIDTGFTDERDSKIMILRPMREFSSKEVAMYNHFYGMEPVTVPNLSTKATRNSSIHQLTESFVTGLQAEFPSTVSTIFRTGSKMQLTTNQRKTNADTCSLCKGPLDTSVGDASALNATQLSMKLSRRQLGVDARSATNPDAGVCCGEVAGCNSNLNTKTEQACCGEGDGSCRSNTNTEELTLDMLNDALCYGCRLLVRDMNDFKQLPRTITDEIYQKKRRQQMRAEIDEFLLSDNDAEDS